jgi:hypothetical protein
MGMTYRTHGNEEKWIHDFGGKTRRKSPLGRARRRWENNIEIYFREIVWGNMDWIHLVQEWDQRRDLVNRAMNLLLP